MMTKIDQNVSALNQYKTLVVYGRDECHLCQDMVLALQNLQEQVSFTFQVINIDSNPELIALYGERIPVLMSPLNNQEICHYFLDLAALDDYLDKFR